MSNKSFKTLYKKTSAGKVQEWTMHVSGAEYWAITGQVDGALMTKLAVTAEPKNLGRANATTAEAQAELEASAKFQKKLDKGYTPDIDKVDAALDAWFKPMLAKVYAVRKGWVKSKGLGMHDKRAYTGKDKVVFPGIIQDKLDGIRYTLVAGGGNGRGGNDFGGAFHIKARLEDLFADNPELRLDGELYNHKFKDEFEDLVSLIKKSEAGIRKDPARQARVEEYVQYHVYDVPVIGELTASDNWHDRWTAFITLLEQPKYADLVDILIPVAHIHVKTHAEVEVAYQDSLERGYEGSMLRYDLPYEAGKKTWNLLKIKPFFDEEFELVDLEPGVGEWAGIAKTAVIRLVNGDTQGSGIGGTKADLKKKLVEKAKYIGKTVTVRHWGRLKSGRLRFPGVIKWGREDYEDVN